MYGKRFESLGGSIRLGFEVTDFLESSDNPNYPVTVVGNNAVSDIIGMLVSCFLVHCESQL